MSKSSPSVKIALAAPQTIPLDKLSVHEANVRQIKSGVSIESLAADIARRGLLQSLSVRPLLDEARLRNRPLRRPGRRPPLARAAIAGQAEEARQKRPCPLHRSHAKVSSRPTVSPKTPNAKRCIRSISSAPSRRCATKARAKTASPPLSA